MSICLRIPIIKINFAEPLAKKLNGTHYHLTYFK